MARAAFFASPKSGGRKSSWVRSNQDHYSLINPGQFGPRLLVVQYKPVIIAWIGLDH